MSRRGFTLVELLIGMVVTTMVLSAMAMVAFAVSNGWQAAESADAASITGTQVQTRMTQLFRPACTLGAALNGSFSSSSNPASVFFWQGDTANGATPANDGKIEFYEIGLLRYHPASKELRFYEATDWSTWSSSAKSSANAIAGTSYISSTGNMADFMTACPHYRVVMRNVTGMVLSTNSSLDKPLIEYVINLEDSKGNSSSYYGTVALRTATVASN